MGREHATVSKTFYLLAYIYQEFFHNLVPDVTPSYKVNQLYTCLHL